MSDEKYKAAYLRQKKAREQAEQLLESRSRELYEAHQSLVAAYTKLKDQKAHLLHQEKLASLGQLAAGVAHEINNPTGYVKSNLSSLQSYFENIQKSFNSIEILFEKNPDKKNAIKPTPKDNILDEYKKILDENDIHYILDDTPDLVTDSIDGLTRVQEIVKNLKTFARPEQAAAVEYDIKELIESTLKILNNELKYRANITIELEPTPFLFGHPGNISQVILNLLVNASHAVKPMGEIFIGSKIEEGDVIVQIKDNGQGISQDNIMKIFDPFFTTKDVGSGTGLGLSVSHSIIKKHGGRIHVDSKENEGTTFTITLPVEYSDDSRANS